jgi:hypothetical protein
MNKFLFNITMLTFLIPTLNGMSQCNVTSRVYPDGSLVYSTPAEVFYENNDLSLKACILTDKEYYFLCIYPTPYPNISLIKQIKDDATLTLANQKSYILKHHNTRFIESDSLLEIVYAIKKTDIEDLRLNEAEKITLDMLDTTGHRTYIFKLHKKLIMEQLNCFIQTKDD